MEKSLQNIQKLRIWKKKYCFKVKVKDSAKVGEAIVNKAIAKDPKNEPVESDVVITPQSKKGKLLLQR